MWWLGALALASSSGAGFELWRWLRALALGFALWRWLRALALASRFDAGFELWRWLFSHIRTEL